MVARAKRGIVNFFYPAFELGGYALVWMSAAYIIWVLVREIFGDSFIDSFSQIISL